MAITTITAIYIGNFAEIDTVEGSTFNPLNTTGENYTTGFVPNSTSVTAAGMQVLSIAQEDAGQGTIQEDDRAYLSGAFYVPAGSFTYDTGGGSVTSVLDHSMVINAAVLLGDGSTINVQLSVFQTLNGDMFIADPDLNNRVIQSINFGSLVNDFYSNKDPNLQTSGATLSVCFAADSMILTDRGQVCIADLAAGDLVQTMDHGLQPIRWIGSNRIDAIDLRVNEKLYPVRIKAGALGDHMPEHDLLVSRQHRMFVRSKVAARMFGAEEVLVSAHRLLGLKCVELATDVDHVEYYHMLFDRHEVVFANGAPAESLLTGQEALHALSDDARAEIELLFPEVLDPLFVPETARHVVAVGHQARKMLERHHLHGLALVTEMGAGTA